MTNKRMILLADGALLLTALIWGVSFPLMKIAVEVVPPNLLLALRFGVGTAGLLPFVWKKLVKADRRALLSGLLLGIVLYAGFVAQAVGLKYTTAGKNAFITTVYVVLAPFSTWLFYKKRPSLYTFAAALVCFLGIGILSLDGAGGFNIGDALTLLCGVLFALQLSLTDRYVSEGQDITLLTMLQFAAAGAAALAVGLFTERLDFEPTPEIIGSLAFLCIVATLIAYLLQNFGLKYASCTHASLLLGCESLFGCLAGIILLGEAFTPRIAVGGGMILAATLFSELQRAKTEAACAPDAENAGA